VTCRYATTPPGNGSTRLPTEREAHLSSSQYVATPLIHLVNPLWDANGGSDWRTIETWRLLRASGAHADRLQHALAGPAGEEPRAHRPRGSEAAGRVHLTRVAPPAWRHGSRAGEPH